MSALRDLIIGEAELDDDEGEESFDEETGEVRRRTNGMNGVNGHLDDSSEEDEDDDDEEAARAVIPPGYHSLQVYADYENVANRFERALSLTMPTNLRSANDEDRRGKSAEEKSETKKRQAWMKRISTSLGKLIQSTSRGIPTR